MIFRRSLLMLSLAGVASVLIVSPSLTHADTPKANEAATLNVDRQRYDQALIDHAIKDKPPFTELKLASGVRSKSYSPAWNAEGIFTTPSGPMYIMYQLPLPPGATAGETMRDIGTLEMGKIHPLAKPGWGAWSFLGYAGNTPVVQDHRRNLFALYGERLAPVAQTFAYRPDEQTGCGTLADGSSCERGAAGSGVIVYSRSTSGIRHALVTEEEVNVALGGRAVFIGIPAGVFNFDGHDYFNFDGAIFEIDGGTLSLIGVGSELAYNKRHIVLQDWHDSGYTFNEEEVP